MKPQNFIVRMALISVVATTSANADIPKVISYQGKITDSGVPVPDGTYTMRFRIYDAASGGSPFWDSGNQSVNLNGGVFSILLGQSPQPVLDLLFDEAYWLQVTFGGVDQVPRQKLGSTPYAYMASGLVTGTEVSGPVIGSSGGVLTVTNTSPTGNAYGIYVSSHSTSGAGLIAIATPTTGSGSGIDGVTNGQSGIGINGYATNSNGTSIGVRGGSESPDGWGVYGFNMAEVGNAIGVYGMTSSNTGFGVMGETFGQPGGAPTGVYGLTASSTGRGVFGQATHTMGWTIGVHGESNSTVGSAIYGHAAATTGSAVGVRGKTESNGNGVGVYGIATATTGSSKGVWGQTASPSGYGVYYTGGLAGTGTKSCVVRTSQGPTLLYCQESPENWFEDFGRAQLTNGRAHVELDPLFLETVTIDGANPLNVFVQLRGDCHGVYVEEGSTYFEVIELQGGTSSVPFVYRVVAKRKGFEEKRLDFCAAAKGDFFLFPERREEAIFGSEADRALAREERDHSEIAQGERNSTSDVKGGSP